MNYPQKFLLLVSCLFLGLIAFPAQAQQKYVLGRILDQDTQKGVDRAVVLNKRTQQKARTNTAGRFVVMALPGDSLIVTSQTHNRGGTRWDGSKEEPTIVVKRHTPDEKVIQLEEVTVVGKHEEELRRELEKVLKEPEIRKNLSSGEILSMAASPITLIYQIFSKRAKSDRKAAALWQEYRWHQLAEQRFRQVAGNATDLSGEKLDQFMTFCRFNDDFLLSTSDYDLTYAILGKFKRFQNSLGMH
ncbi:peptidase associated/transthyretin-like domain-containing protein [Tellurirhabdus bombi]|uniref:hypothetical protein n=1 Tax=Tellurirhabdus bombi TaxID=2907205 RepID=UPI001F365C86|nr:hypothetical protein [Tellurirhabdus bombi]